MMERPASRRPIPAGGGRESVAAVLCALHQSGDSWHLHNARRYERAALLSEVIHSFADRKTERLFRRKPVRRFPADLRRVMLRKLVLVDAAERLDDLRVPPGNRLEKLKGSRSGEHSIRINVQWRICFRWHEGGAYAVAVVEYH